MVGDEMAEKVMAYGVRITGKLNAAALKTAFHAIGSYNKGRKELAEQDYANAKARETVLPVHELEQDGQLHGFELTAAQTCGFDAYAKKYGLQYSILQEENDPQMYVFFFRMRDAAKWEAAARDYIKDPHIEHGDLEQRIEKAKVEAMRINKARQQEREQQQYRKTPGKDRAMER